MQVTWGLRALPCPAMPCPALPWPALPCRAAGARASSALAQPLILGGALGSAWVNLARQHPTNPKLPLVDFQALLLMLPAMMCGVAAGEWAASRPEAARVGAAWQCCRALGYPANMPCPPRSPDSVVSRPKRAVAPALPAIVNLPASILRSHAPTALPPRFDKLAATPKLRPSARCLAHAGVLLNNTFPNYLIIILLQVWLFWQCWMSFAKTHMLYRAHQQQHAKTWPAQQSEQTQQTDLLLQQQQQRQQASTTAGAILVVSTPASTSPRAPAEPQVGSHSPHVTPVLDSLRSPLSYPIPSSAAGWMREGSWEYSRAAPQHAEFRGHSAQVLSLNTSGREARRSHASSMPPGGTLALTLGVAGAGGATVPEAAGATAAETGGAAGLVVLGAGGPGCAAAAAAALEKQAGLCGLANKGASPVAGRLKQPQSLVVLASEAAKQALDDVLRLPRFDRPSLRRLLAVGCIWGGFVALQAARAATSKSKGTPCFGGYYAMLATEFALLLVVAAGHTWSIAARRAARAQRAKGGAMAVLGPGGQGEGAVEEEEEEEEGEQACWSLRKLVVVQLVVAFGGTFATLLGLGGGELSCHRTVAFAFACARPQGVAVA
jgi:hypothetical protein